MTDQFLLMYREFICKYRVIVKFCGCKVTKCSQHFSYISWFYFIKIIGNNYNSFSLFNSKNKGILLK